jgi:hypothetical protein
LNSRLYFAQSKNRAFRSDLGKIIKKIRKTIVYIMQFYNVRLLGSLAAFALLGVNTGQAQTPANVSGGFAEFTPTINLSSLQTTANGLTHSTAAFPLPPIAGHPVAILPISPGFFNQQQSLFLPIDPQSQPAKTGNFALLGGVSVSYPQDGIFIEFTQFREDTIGNLFALVTVNGKSMGEVHLVSAIGAHFSPSPDRTQFIITAKLQVSAALAQAVNALFNTTVLTPGEVIATEDLVADVLNF